MEVNASTRLSLYEHQSVLGGGSFQELLRQTATTSFK